MYWLCGPTEYQGVLYEEKHSSGKHQLYADRKLIVDTCDLTAFNTFIHRFVAPLWNRAKPLNWR